MRDGWRPARRIRNAKEGSLITPSLVVTRRDCDTFATARLRTAFEVQVLLIRQGIPWPWNRL